jgi:hypothetical protein
MALGVGGGPMAPGGAAAARDTMFRVGNGGREWLDGVWMSLGIALDGYRRVLLPVRGECRAGLWWFGGEKVECKR